MRALPKKETRNTLRQSAHGTQPEPQSTTRVTGYHYSLPCLTCPILSTSSSSPAAAANASGRSAASSRPKQLLSLFSDRDAARSHPAPTRWPRPARAHPHPHQCRPGEPAFARSARLCRRKTSSPSRPNATPPPPSRSAPAGSRGAPRRDDDRAARGSPHPGHRRLSAHAARRRRRGRADGRTRHHRHQADLGLSRLWLHRAVGAPSRSLTRGLAPAGLRRRALPRKTERGTGRDLSRAGQFPLERRHVHLVGPGHPQRLQSPRAGARRVHRPHARQRRISRRCSRDEFPAAAEDLHRLRHHGKGRRASSSSKRPSIGTTWAAGRPSPSTSTDDAAGNHANAPLKTLEAGEQHRLLPAAERPSRCSACSDLIVVQTADALLVCNRHEAEKIKQLVAHSAAGTAMKRALGIDHGDARIGLAISDELGNARASARDDPSEGSRRSRRAHRRDRRARQDRHDRPRPAAQHGRHLRPRRGKGARLCRETARRLSVRSETLGRTPHLRRRAALAPRSRPQREAEPRTSSIRSPRNSSCKAGSIRRRCWDNESAGMGSVYRRLRVDRAGLRRESDPEQTVWSDELEYYRQERNYSRQEVFEAMVRVGQFVSEELLSPLWGGLAMLAGGGLVGGRAATRNP